MNKLDCKTIKLFGGRSIGSKKIKKIE